MSEVLPMIRRIWFTPWQDIVRLRLSSRLDWRAAIDQSGLPAEIRSIIYEVVKGSRLTTTEKASVTKELSAHFQDGIEAGQAIPQLISDFGDVAIVTKLIQRSKERNRSMFSKMIKVLAGASAVTVVVAIVWLIFFANRRANPVVDYFPRLNNRAVAADPAEKAWPIYRDSWTRHRFVEWYPEQDLPDVHSVFENIRPGDAGWERVLGMLDERSDLIDALRRGARLPALGLEAKATIGQYGEADQRALFPSWFESTTPEQRAASDVDEEFRPSVMGALLPHTQAMRTAGQLLVIDSRRAMEKGDLQHAIENVELTFGLAHQASESSCLVSALRGFAVADLAFLQIEDLLLCYSSELSNDDLVRLQKVIEKQDFRIFMQLDGERTMIPDLLQCWYTDDGNGGGKITRTGLFVMMAMHPDMRGPVRKGPSIQLVWTLLFSSRKEIQSAVDAWFDRFELLLDKAWYEDSRTSEELIADIADSDSAERFLMDALLPSGDGIRASLHAKLTRQEAAITAIALYRAKRANGSWPEKLEELVPEYIEKVPVDRMTGKNILYRLDPDPVLYTPGPDGDDDQGAPLTDEYGNSQKFPFNLNASWWQGDWVIWPVSNRK